MIETSWNNHYRIGYDERWFGMRQTPHDVLHIGVAGTQRRPSGFSTECVNSARLMTERYGQENIAVLYSGGRDSEIIALSFIGYGIVPRLIFLDYDGSNAYDKKKALEFCAYYNLELEVRPMPVTEMLSSGEAVEVAGRYQCGQVGLAFYLKALEELCKDYYVVTGDEPYIEYVSNPVTRVWEWSFFVREAFYSLWKVFVKNERDGCPNFIQYTPESWIAFWDDPHIQWLLNQKVFTHSNQVKYDLYRARFFTKDRTKSTGMELLAPKIIEANRQLMQAFPLCSTEEVKVPFRYVYGQLTRYLP